MKKNKQTLAEILAETGDYSVPHGNGGMWVYLSRKTLASNTADYWHLADYSVSSRASDVLFMIPRFN